LPASRASREALASHATYNPSAHASFKSLDESEVLVQKIVLAFVLAGLPSLAIAAAPKKEAVAAAPKDVAADINSARADGRHVSFEAHEAT